ncbi:molybdopterin biosynthesis protein MoeB [Aedoeadaptatus ivorii]|uniref:Molybdopterin biosynthesis protein MoeB n=1 Tax=Aedoeadaptatus ivorii TaxID=54006 RepID=A0A3S5AJS0_9FIRM|nr:molybdopterin biosynthesis protein MoeB [Peptoniphilus ivorii]
MQPIFRIASSGIESTTADELADGEDRYILDVRNPDEHAEGIIPGAVKMPLPTVKERMDEIPREEKIYVICAAGGRSIKACKDLMAHGYRCVNVKDGMNAYHGPLEK